MKVAEAVSLTTATSAIFIFAAYELNWICFVLSPLALGIVFFYSLTKRFTWASHLFLGLALAIAPVGAGLLYFATAILLGLMPGTARPIVGPRDYAFFACDNGVHVDLVLPVVGGGRDWFSYFPPRDFAGDVAGASHVALGWGARDFYIATPRWGDIRPWQTLRALFWLDRSVLHVTYGGDPAGRANCRVLATDAFGRDALSISRRCFSYMSMTRSSSS